MTNDVPLKLDDVKLRRLLTETNALEWGGAKYEKNRRRYKQAMIRKWRNQKEITSPKPEDWESTKLAIRYLY